MQVRLYEVADIGLESAANRISREGASRKVTVSCNVAEDANLGHLVAAVRAVVDPIAAELGVTVRYGGQFEAQQEASRTIAIMGVGVVLVIFLILAATLASASAAALVLINLPLSLIGGILAIFIAESAHPLANISALLGLGGVYIAPVVSIASLVGFVTLFGIAVRNGILLVHRWQARLAAGESVPVAVLGGSSERLVAILMTALTAAIGLVPLALTAGKPGSEILAPLAVVVLGGLASSTILNLFVVPAAFAWVFSRHKPCTVPDDDTPPGERPCVPSSSSPS
jgi:HME family heavy-metal exporter